MDDELREKIRELGHLMEHATAEDDDRIAELDTWLTHYMETANPAQRAEAKMAIGKLAPIAVTTLMEIVQNSQDPLLVSLCQEMLEQMGTLRPGGRN